jgi:hypothetical protein
MYFSDVGRLNPKRLTEHLRGQRSAILCLDEFVEEHELFVARMKCAPVVRPEQRPDILGWNPNIAKSSLDTLAGQSQNFRRQQDLWVSDEI